jgi:ATP-binding cassette, subfamily B, bacterial
VPVSSRPGTSWPPRLADLLWPTDQVAAALAAAASGLAGDVPPPACGDGPGAPAASGGSVTPAGAGGPGAFAAGNGDPAAGLAGLAGLAVDSVDIPWLDLRRALARLAPGVLEVTAPAPGLLVLLPASRWRLSVFAPSGRVLRLSGRRLAGALLATAAERHRAAVEPILAALPLGRRRRERARRALVGARLAAGEGARAHLLAAAGGQPIGRELRAGGLAGAGAAMTVTLAAAQGLALLSWYLLGRGLLDGRLAPTWLLSWALLVLTLPLARGGESAAAMAFGRRAGLLLRRRLFARLLAIDPECLRGEGTGRLLGRLLAAESLERAAVAGGVTALVASGELAGAAVALAHGAAARPQLATLAVALVAAALLHLRQAGARRAYGERRLALTADLVEAMAGHRTRLTQAGGETSAREDAKIAAQHHLGRRLARGEVLLRTLLPGGFWLAGLAGLATALGAANASPARVAASLGGLLLARAAVSRVGAALCELAAARDAAREVAPILTADAGGAGGDAGGARGKDDHLSHAGADWERDQPEPRGDRSCGPLLEARDLTVRLPGRSEPILAGAGCQLRAGDRVALEGPSGAGKSTLAAVLAGHMRADGGLLLLGGFDLAALGAARWRRRVVAVPQLHANHLFAESLAFNLLLGRGWPPGAADLADADAVCRDLGLGPLLDRLPAGLEQRIGEAGWQLSDGEASRVCLARALLQDPGVLILDESLAALDPEGQVKVLQVAERRARTLVVIGHPRAASGISGV